MTCPNEWVASNMEHKLQTFALVCFRLPEWQLVNILMCHVQLHVVMAYVGMTSDKSLYMWQFMLIFTKAISNLKTLYPDLNVVKYLELESCYNG
jgi:hypothetical protein